MNITNLLKNKNNTTKYLFVVFPFFLIITIYIFNDFFIYLKNFLPQCMLRKISGFYCPGCGNTRSVIALLKGDILTSLRYNITPIFLGILILLAYFEQVSLLFDKKIKLIPRSIVFWVLTTILLVSYFIFRNFIPYFTPK